MLQKDNNLHTAIVPVAEELKEPYPKDALILIDAIINIDIKEPNYFNLRGAIKRKEGDLSGAINDFNEALKLNENNKSAWYGLGFAYADDNQLDNACKALRKTSDYGHWKVKERIESYAVHICNWLELQINS